VIALLTLLGWAVLIAWACAQVAWLVRWRRRVLERRADDAPAEHFAAYRELCVYVAAVAQQHRPGDGDG
jgi:hypothetical protein